MSESTEKVHFIAIGGSAMHNLALALHSKGYEVTGSDDEIFEPSRTRLEKAGILPKAIGWFPEKIHGELDAVILGMHARKDNPELLKAQELGLKVYSYPEYIYSQCTHKQRVVIAGSHGKTTITSMILHVLKYYKRKFDYLVGAQIEGFDTMVQLTEDAPVIIIEGDEYLSSPIDPTPKFLHYKHHMGVISGIAWDHINVFPTFNDYVKQFDAFADSSPKGGVLIYSEEDDLATLIGRKEREDVLRIEYETHKHVIKNGKTFLKTDEGDVSVQVFGDHNMKNISAAKAVCNRLGVNDKMFYEAITNFKGAANRLEVLAEGNSTIVFKDFAHAPSKLSATTNAVKKQYEKRELTAVLELHTFSSLNKEFLPLYRESFGKADEPIVYYNPETLKHKKLPELAQEDLIKAFDNPKLKVYTDNEKLKSDLLTKEWNNRNLLLMSSGNFAGMNIKELAQTITHKK
jgi:UDP-N-acetylmuramate: L-alanyl-gamma-D-glutamyl-meso-diaminopimelate ligase